MKKQDDMAYAILNMKPTRSDKEANIGIGIGEDESEPDPIRLASVEMMQAVKTNDSTAFAEALRAAILACKYDDDGGGLEE